MPQGLDIVANLKISASSQRRPNWPFDYRRLCVSRFCVLDQTSGNRFSHDHFGCWLVSFILSFSVILKEVFSIYYRVSVQGVKSLGGHFACICQELDFYEVRKNIIIFQKEKGNTFTLLIIFIVKSLQKEQNSTNLLLWPPICRNKPAITPKWFNSLDTNSMCFSK